MANTIKQRVKEALDSPTLGVALDRAPPTFRARRGAYFDSPERTIDFDVERHELAIRRAEGVERLPELVDRFTAEARKIGAVVHHAANAADACAIVSRLAAERGVKTIETLEAASAEWIISGSTSCVVTILQDYPRLFRSEPEWHARALALGKRVIDFTHFVDQVIRPETGTLANGPAFAVTLHDSCQSHNCLRLRPEARRLITDVCGLELRELHESSFCCGFGGSFSLEFPEISRRILARKLSGIKSTAADAVVTDNPGCIMHMRGGMHAAGRDTRVLHLAELLAERLPS